MTIQLSKDFVSFPVDDTEIIVQSQGVPSLLLDIDTTKSCGPDNITGNILKTFAKVIAPTLTLVFQFSIGYHCIPDVWRLTKIQPIYKNGGRGSANNYRPVSLICIPYKLLEHIISKIIHEHLDILTKFPHGFKKGHSCVKLNWHTFFGFYH